MSVQGNSMFLVSTDRSVDFCPKMLINEGFLLIIQGCL